ncbi:hypothetical protein GBA63_16650 [Rubrobacter tropicus]|uniref:Uncharacterized protein n=1 Tax=Rubrobacter tropicus TaxID=2653851 RepID=A0A6G8QCC9_9ACTN|nr:hypothetical protein [Rubrobacter tropicus]QIN84092.1 hypothetical protein GBA63_16650 [Rubrobacter tropicus]
MLLTVLLLAACSGETGQNGGAPKEPRSTAATPTTILQETTAEEPPKITLGEEPGGSPQVVLRLEGGPKTTFSGLCSVGGRQSVLGGRVPKRFTFDPGSRELSCRIQKRDDNRGALKIVLVAGDTTRSVQQTNSPGGTINVTYRDG